ncbi:hypothetical protein ONR75_04065 [Rhodopseudomonas sp. P2A-2r]|uniref:hypothetical protein n=1 Tax=Rhodopseudomonas sp. P2A-2r TaxID=2991972 RepID=UPI002233EC47|nr:hypothetical protein [Rhodopseudomonas sp. P2A-2r]UZE49964.1 hypothetical protein ONR75_04065 [Rhodopseudomonas sp. P2A-2r]
MMDDAEFEDLLGRLGDDLAQWPAPQQDAAAILLRSSEKARTALAEARRLRAALQSAPVRAPAGLLDRIVQKARQSDTDGSKDAASETDDAPPTAPKGSALVLALCLLGGVFTGDLPGPEAGARHVVPATQA